MMKFEIWKIIILIILYFINKIHLIFYFIDILWFLLIINIFIFKIYIFHIYNNFIACNITLLI